MLKTNGSLWGELRYSAWGETPYSNGTIVTNRQYTGQINDGDTGLYYNARYYNPALHHFIQADTITLLQSTKTNAAGGFTRRVGFCILHPVGRPQGYAPTGVGSSPVG
jgi:RHS repeat-associated protein